MSTLKLGIHSRDALALDAACRYLARSMSDGPGADRVDTRKIAGDVAWRDVERTHVIVGVEPIGDRRLVDVVLPSAGEIERAWAERLRPFEENLRLQRRAPRRRAPEIVPHDVAWADQAMRIIARLRSVVGSRVIRIDHIGSTSVPGLAAKDLVDIQAVVDDLQTAAIVADAGVEAGFVRFPGFNTGQDRSGRLHEEAVLLDADPGRPTNINIRPRTAPVWREALLFRDWLRSASTNRQRYEEEKHALANRPGIHVDDYSDLKMPFIWRALKDAEAWASETGWSP